MVNKIHPNSLFFIVTIIVVLVGLNFITNEDSIGQSFLGLSKDSRLLDPLIAHFKLNGKAKDASVFKNNGVVHGAIRTKGIRGGALSFNGIDSYVEIPHNDIYNPHPERGLPFSIALIPDTQHYSDEYPEIYESQVRWIVDNKKAKNLIKKSTTYLTTYIIAKQKIRVKGQLFIITTYSFVISLFLIPVTSP